MLTCRTIAVLSNESKANLIPTDQLGDPEDRLLAGAKVGFPTKPSDCGIQHQYIGIYYRALRRTQECKDQNKSAIYHAMIISFAPFDTFANTPSSSYCKKKSAL